MRGDDRPTPATQAAAFPTRRWLLPSAVAVELDPDTGPFARPGRRPRRTVRDWLVDFTCFVPAVVLGLLVADTLTEQEDLPRSLLVADQLLGALSCAAVWLRRRLPVGLAAAAIPFAFLSTTSAGACAIALFTLAVHRPFRYVAWIGGLQLAVTPLLLRVRPGPDLEYGPAVVWTVLLILAVSGWGMLVRSRRQLMLSLRDRAGAPRRRRGCGPSRRSGWPARPSPARCTTCSPTG